ncbi:hypothetical protein [Zavarzinia compransoris]|uniref:Uncharacterized protein n=1 Tax=Zavarzinia compransoris TaxID=1264899 RepID=A0A317E2I9_9PROT|nr:hypothetical protein [Zavarzinia compransoris]PWR19583.1 hypothetical protein DKG75_14005 [Zavarzinia compransoris]TDP40433.1 hypothetical protein DES42_11454 [Zavarzinia compransoris]
MIALLAALALAFALLAAAMPLAVYTVLLAGFGLAHVMAEFAYVDRRFGRRLGRGQVVACVGLLALAALWRALGVFHVMAVEPALVLELGTVVVLILAVAAPGGPRAAALALAAALPLALATALAPFETAVILSIGHNFTPLGLLWEGLPRRRRAFGMGLALAGFVGLPLLVASGLPRALLGLGIEGADPLGTGGIARHLHVYVPRALAGGPSAVDLFAASVVAQGAHYVAVIGILPRLLPGQAKGFLPWPRLPLFAALIAGASLAGFIGFLDDFAGTRGLYGIVASVHAWIELPLLVLIAGGLQASSRPAATEARLAAKDSPSA